MTMPTDHIDDEQISAFLDDVVDRSVADGVTNHLSGCTVCRQRLEAFTRVRSIVGVPPPRLTAVDVDELIGNVTSGVTTADGIIDLAARRRTRIAMGWVAAVAAVAAVLLAVPTLFASGGGQQDLAKANLRGDDTQAFTAADSDAALRSTEESESVAAGGGAAPVADALTAVESTQAAPVPGLGAYTTDDELVRRLVAELSTTQRPASAGDAVAACEDAARAVGGTRLGSLVYAGTLLWRGSDAEVAVFALTEPIGGETRQAYVMAQPACDLLSEPRF